VLDGGEIKDNALTGVMIGSANFIMRNGIISGNHAAGVIVSDGCTFTMSGGTITGNSSETVGGGVVVFKGARFDQTGGTISGNTAKQAKQGSNPNVYRQPGSLGSNLPPGSSRSSSPAKSPAPSTPPRSSDTGSSSGGSGSSPSSSGSSRPSTSRNSSGVDAEFVLAPGFYLRGWRQNLGSLGIPLQIGAEITFGNDLFTLGLLGEAGFGIGFPLLLEYNAGGMAEFYFFTKRIGFGVGGGWYGNLMPLIDKSSKTEEELDSINELLLLDPIKTNYVRLALIFRNISKTSLYANFYGDGHWGFGVQWTWNVW
jgi:hypothetical protein